MAEVVVDFAVRIEADGGGNAVQFGVIPSVEGFHTELEFRAFFYGEFLEQGDIPVVATRSTGRALTEVTPGADGGSREVAHVEKLGVVAVGNGPSHIGTICCSDAVAALTAVQS